MPCRMSRVRVPFPAFFIVNFVSKKEDISDHRIRMKLDVPADQVGLVYQKYLNKLASKTEMPGFRKGKVPPSVVEERHRERLAYDVINEITSISVESFLRENDVPTYGKPFIEDEEIDKKFDPKKPLKFNVICYRPPSCRIKNYEGLSYEEHEVLVDDHDVEEAMTRVLRPHGKLVEVADGIKPLDIVEIDLTFDDPKYAALNLSHHIFYFDEESENVFPPFLKDIKETMLGKKSGDRWSEKKVFSKNLSGQFSLLANAKASYSCVVHKVKRMQLPALDEEMLKKLGVKSEADLKSEIRTNLQNHAEETLREYHAEVLIEQMIKKSEFGLPQLAIDYMVSHYWQQYLERYVEKDKREDVSPDENWLKQARERAEKEIKVQLLLDEMIKQLGELSPSEAEVAREVEKLSKNLEEVPPQNREDLKKRLESDEGRKNIKDKVSRQKAVEYIFAQAKKKKGKQWNYKGLMDFISQQK